MPGNNRKMPKKMRGGGMAAKPKAGPVPPGMRKGGMAKKDEPPGMKEGGGVRRGGRPKRGPKPTKVPYIPTSPPDGGPQAAPDGFKKRPKRPKLVPPPGGMKDGGDATKAKKKAKPKKNVSSGSRVRSSSSKPL